MEVKRWENDCLRAVERVYSSELWWAWCEAQKRLTSANHEEDDRNGSGKEGEEVYTVCKSVEPVVPTVHAKEGHKPGEWGVPR